jgi:O-methyltransferase involved in polyketide biosynthesis
MGEGATPPEAPPRELLLTGPEVTLTIPLYARALDYRSRHPILGDRKADEIVRSVDFDFQRLYRSGNRGVLVVRARQLDDWAREFLRRNPRSTVLHLGCGLDSRVERLEPPAEALWIDVDLPDVILVRRRFYRETPQHRMVPGSLDETGWLDGVPTDRPVLMIADGVLMYLTPASANALLEGIAGRFPTGAFIFDVMNSGAIQRGNEQLGGPNGDVLRWGVDDLAELDRAHPRLRRTGTLSLFAARFLPLRYRVLFTLTVATPSLRSAIRLVRYEF